LHELDERAHHPHPEIRWLDTLRRPRRGRIEHRDQIDVARVVEFARAVFSHGEDEEAGRLAAAPSPGPLFVREREAERRLQRHVGEGGERCGDRFERQRAREIAEA
jgi:hypothetical protein